MQNIGNDIVDLSHPCAVGKHEDHRFVNRILTGVEQENIRSSVCPTALLWTFWAAKESAYKAVSKSFPHVSSVPKQYQVSIETFKQPSVLHGVVTTPEIPVQVQLVIGSDYVHCLGVTGTVMNFDWIETGIYQTREPTGADKITLDRESILVREVARERIAKYTGIAVSEIEIRREIKQDRPGPPAVFLNRKKSTINISLSHDGRFVAYAFFPSGD